MWYLLIFIFSMLFFPHKVLSRQFLTPKMEKKYKQLDYELRQKSVNLFANNLCHHHDELAYLLSGPLTADNFTNIHNMLQSSKQLTFKENVSMSVILQEFMDCH